MSGVEPTMAAVPEVGEHTNRILAELGYDEEDIAALYREEVV
jgi:crotonobetainyl-CoA:carnitine CoA-transferase CaiB-like acyl-CoA transferase